MENLTGKTVLITGASSGIGRATAYEFAKMGCNLVLTARREERLKEVVENAEKMGVKAVYYAGDCGEEKTAVNTVNLAVETFGHLDILINNAGIGQVKSLLDSTVEEYDEMMDTNVRSAFLFTKYGIVDMLKRNKGNIVIVSSVTGIEAQPGETIYTATKFALRGFSQAIQKEYGDKGIKCCTFCPCSTKTEFEMGHGRTQETLDNAGWWWLTPEEAAEAIVFACTRPGDSRVHELVLL